MRTFDPDVICQAVAPYLHELHGFIVDDFVKDEDNYAFTNENLDVSLFQMQRPGVYCGHYFFHSRGRAAVNVARLFLDEAFASGVVQVVEGLTPLHKLGALWVNKQLGLKSYGVTDTSAGLCEIVIVTKKEWLNE